MSNQQPSAAAIVEGVLYELMIDTPINELLKKSAAIWVEDYLARHETAVDPATSVKGTREKGMSEVKEVSEHEMLPFVFEGGKQTEYRDILLNIKVQRYDNELGILLTRRSAWLLVDSLLLQLQKDHKEIALWLCGLLRPATPKEIVVISSKSRR